MTATSMITSTDPDADTIAEDAGSVGRTPWGLRYELRVVAGVWGRETRRFLRARGQMVGMLAQPLLLLVVFGVGVEGVAGAVDQHSYVQYILPGIIATAVVNASLSNSSTVVWDREFGFLREMVVSPASRVSLLAGKLAGSITSSALQGLFVLALAPLTGLWPDPGRIVGTIGAILLLAASSSSIGLLMAVRARSVRDTQGVLQIVVMPMMLLSGALFPLDQVPAWLRWIGTINPIGWGVDLVRCSLLNGIGGGDIAVCRQLAWETTALVVALVVCLLAAARRFARTE
ncbi:MAG: type transport system permease protein [Actinomycetota bacterium]|nr:type transport system permease protein [Actinomycetota bacterium]